MRKNNNITQTNIGRCVVGKRSVIFKSIFNLRPRRDETGDRNRGNSFYVYMKTKKSRAP